MHFKCLSFNTRWSAEAACLTCSLAEIELFGFFFFLLCPITKLNASLQRIIFHSPTPNFDQFPLISTSTAIVPYTDEGRLRS